MRNQKSELSPPGVSGNAPSREHDFIHRVLIFFGIGAIFLLLIALFWFASSVFLLAFSSVLLAILLDTAAGGFEKWLPVSRGVALGLVLLAVVAVLGLGGWLLAPQVIEQVNQLVAALPKSLQQLRGFLEQSAVLRQAMGSLPPPGQILGDMSGLLTRAGSAFSGVLGFVGNFAIVLFVGIYLAIQPQVYTNGIVKLLPPQRRQRGKAVLAELGETLSLWLRGKLLAMTVVGVTTAVGLTLLGIPLGLALGLLAGLLDFIPYIGPILAAVPAIMIAFSEGPTSALYVVFLFLGLQALESYLLLPLVERKTVSLPPALTITMQVLMGVGFGLVGVALATPLLAVIAVLIAMLYVQDVLGDTVTLPGEQE